jgi:hypothetical protein
MIFRLLFTKSGGHIGAEFFSQQRDRFIPAPAAVTDRVFHCDIWGGAAILENTCTALAIERLKGRGNRGYRPAIPHRPFWRADRRSRASEAASSS